MKSLKTPKGISCFVNCVYRNEVMKNEFVDFSFFSLNFNSKLFPMSIFYEEWIKTEAQITSIFIFLFF